MENDNLDPLASGRLDKKELPRITEKVKFRSTSLREARRGDVGKGLDVLIFRSTSLREARPFIANATIVLDDI